MLNIVITLGSLRQAVELCKKVKRIIIYNGEVYFERFYFCLQEEVGKQILKKCICYKPLKTLTRKQPKMKLVFSLLCHAPRLRPGAELVGRPRTRQAPGGQIQTTPGARQPFVSRGGRGGHTGNPPPSTERAPPATAPPVFSSSSSEVKKISISPPARSGEPRAAPRPLLLLQPCSSTCCRSPTPAPAQRWRRRPTPPAGLSPAPAPAAARGLGPARGRSGGRACSRRRLRRASAGAAAAATGTTRTVPGAAGRRCWKRCGGCCSPRRRRMLKERMRRMSRGSSPSAGPSSSSASPHSSSATWTEYVPRLTNPLLLHS